MLRQSLFLALVALTTSAKPISSGTINQPQIEERTSDSVPDAKASCRTFYADIYAETDSNVDLKSILGGPPANQQELTERQIQAVAAGSTIQQQIFTGPRISVNGTYSLWFEYCEPKEGVPKGVYQAHHGIVGNAGYWNVHSDDYKTYSFAENAAAAGWATLSYDRLGVGRSAKPDGTNVVQAAFEIAQSVAVAQKLRDGSLGDVGKFDKIVGIGHSYGSGLVTGLASVSPTSFDAIVLTGFTNNVTLGPLGATAIQPTIASVAYPERFEGLPNDYVVSASSAADQVVFFHYPNYTQDAFEEFTRTKGEFTLGQINSLPVAFTYDRQNYTNPLFVIVGEYDTVFCAAKCSLTSIQPTEQVPNPSQLDSTKGLFPSVDNFQTYIIPDTAHGINYSPTARLAYEKIFEFVESLGF